MAGLADEFEDFFSCLLLRFFAGGFRDTRTKEEDTTEGVAGVPTFIDAG